MTVSPDQRYKVIHLHQLKSLVNKLIKETEEDVFSDDLQFMYDELYQFTKDEASKLMHLATQKFVKEMNGTESRLAIWQAIEIM